MINSSKKTHEKLQGVTQFGLFVLFTLLALAYNIVIPVGEGVDEIPHFEYVSYVSNNWSIPVQPWQENGQPLQVWMAHHPPLYYFLMASVSTWAETADINDIMQPNPHFAWTETDPSNGWNVYLHTPAEQFPYQGSILTIHYLRLWSLLMGLVTIFAVIKAGNLILPSRPWIVLTAAALTAFHPAFLFMSSTIHHDPFMAMIFALSLWWMVRAIHYQPTLLGLLAGGFLLGAGLITKLAGLSLIPLFGLTLLLITWRTKAWRKFILWSFVIFGIASLIAGWWYVRNQILYGDVLAWDMFLTIFSHMERQTSYSWYLFRYEFLGQLANTFWGAFGYMHIILPVAIRRVFWLGSVFVLLGAMWAAWRRGPRLSREAKLSWLVLLTAVFLVFLSFFRLSLNMLGAGQGRYLMTIILPISLLLAIGIHQWLGFRWPRLTMLTVGLAYFAFSTWVLFVFVRPLYALPPVATAEQIAATDSVNMRFGDAIELVGMQVDANGIAPGESGELILFWRPLGESRPDLYLKLRIIDAANNKVYAKEMWPLPSSSTAAWENDDVYITRHNLDILPTAVIGPSIVELTLQQEKNGDSLVTGQQSLPPLFIGKKNNSTLAVEDIPYPQQALLDNRISLLGYDLQTPTTDSPALDLTLYWQIDQPLSENYTVFIHVLDENGRLLAQQDSQPNQGLYPTATWDTQTIIQDSYTLPFLPDGQTYSIQTGMYTWPTLERLPVTQNGAPSGDAIILDIQEEKR